MDVDRLDVVGESVGDLLDEIIHGDLVVLDHADDLQLRNACKSIVR